jgi:aryl-alcohol dehydrogenase-like predicted oxidoreductase
VLLRSDHSTSSFTALMHTRTLAGVAVAEIGLGCMNLSHAYGVPPTPPEAKHVLARALELGVTHFDSAALYGFGANESLLGEFLPPFRSRIHLASKCGMTGVNGKRVIDGRPEALKRTLDESLTRLRTEVIDLYYLHRWDRAVPIEDSIGAMAEMVRAGKIRAIGLSEVSAATLRRAHAVHPIAALQSEFSLWSRNAEVAALDACREIGAAYVAFSPLARGFLTGALGDPSTLVHTDLRRSLPRFQEPHWSANAQLLPAWRALAAEAGCTPAQLALAWLLHRAAHIIPIPGTTSVSHLEENVHASDVRLAPPFLGRIEALINSATVRGPRYSEAVQREIDTEELPG